jgi:hypothetical protein
VAQTQTRKAAIYARINTWSQAASTGTYNSSAIAEQTDVDLDGESEYLIYNDRIFALFERIGGRMTHAWVRDYDTGYVSQVIGNSVGYAGSETEEEGTSNFTGAAVNAFRTSAFKDWFAQTDGGGGGTSAYINQVYNVVAAPSGIEWKFTSTDGKIAKTITLAPGKSALQVNYATTGLVQLFVRCGLSPDLYDLLQYGQSHLSVAANAQEFNVFNNNSTRTLRAYLRYGGSGFSGASLNASATDLAAGITPDTLPMRNQAQTQQVELQGNGTMNFALGFETGSAQTYDGDSDGIPDWWTQQYFGHAGGQAGDLSRPGDDADRDGRTNLEEYILGTNPNSPDSALAELTITRTSPSTTSLTFRTIHDRRYQISYRNSLSGAWQTAGNPIFGTGSTGNYIDNGTDTGSPPTTTRYYKLEVSLIP